MAASPRFTDAFARAPGISARSPGKGPACPRCGGAGHLRLDDQRFRTCMDCLGKGLLPIPGEGVLPLPRIRRSDSVSAA